MFQQKIRTNFYRSENLKQKKKKKGKEITKLRLEIGNCLVGILISFLAAFNFYL